MSKSGVPKSNFTQAEAEGKIGMRVRSRAGYSGVLQGTEGMIVGMATEVSQHNAYYRVAIQWETARGGRPFEEKLLAAISGGYTAGPLAKPRVDWFSRDEYERFLEEVASPE